MVIAASLSILVANVAVTVMLIPIVDSVFQELAISVYTRHFINIFHLISLNSVDRGRKKTNYLPRVKRGFLRASSITPQNLAVKVL